MQAISSAGARAVVAIPTYRRPDKLERLLQSLKPSLEAVHASVVVADNACDDATRKVVERFAVATPRVTYVPVPERGITANRNALLNAFLAAPGEPPWLAMADDDLTLAPQWLTELLAAGERYGADIVGAPYALERPTGRFVIDQSVFVQRPRPASGPCPPIATAGNFLISRRLLATHPQLRFQTAYGLSGGEDYDFFRTAAKCGAQFAWCDEAFATEDVDVSRLNTRAVLWRYYSTGNYMAIIDSQHDGRASALGRLAEGALKSAAMIAQGVLRADRARALRGVFLSLFNLGGLAALAGSRVYRYR